MRKLYFIAALALIAALCLSACGQKPAVEPPATDVPATDVPATDVPATDAPATTEPSALPSMDDYAVKAYREALTAMLETNVLPGYTEPTPELDASEAAFAVLDIDGDGARELLLSVTPDVVAGQVALVLGYDEASGKLYIELEEFPSLTFYSNGVIKADWSHNQGLAGEFWPFNLYAYDIASDVYTRIAEVDAWDKKLSETDSDGNAFPAEADKSGTGVVYYIYTEQATDPEPVDSDGFDAWLASVLGESTETHIELTPLTADNVAAIR